MNSQNKTLERRVGIACDGRSCVEYVLVSLRQQFVLDVRIIEVFLASMGRHNARLYATNMFSKLLLHPLVGFAVWYEGVCQLLAVVKKHKMIKPPPFH